MTRHLSRTRSRLAIVLFLLSDVSGCGKPQTGDASPPEVWYLAGEDQVDLEPPDHFDVMTKMRFADRVRATITAENAAVDLVLDRDSDGPRIVLGKQNVTRSAVFESAAPVDSTVKLHVVGLDGKATVRYRVETRLLPSFLRAEIRDPPRLEVGPLTQTPGLSFQDLERHGRFELTFTANSEVPAAAFAERLPYILYGRDGVELGRGTVRHARFRTTQPVRCTIVDVGLNATTRVVIGR